MSTANSEHSHDLEKQDPSLKQDGKIDSAPDVSAPPPIKEKPGAKAGLTVFQFWVVLVGLNIGMLLTALDFNIVATAVPIISSKFNSYNNSAWLGSGFLITFALVLPLYSKFGDIFGRKNMFLFGTIIFCLGSALCGWSQSMDMLIWSRVIQGLGAGGIYGLVNVIVTDLVPLQDVGKYISLTALIWAIADVAGPLLGGAFSQYATWRWCFWINLIISPISFAITLFCLKLPAPKVNIKEKMLQFDYLGTIAAVGGTTALLLGLLWGGNDFPWNSPKVIGTLVGGIVLLIIFVTIEFFVKDPLIPPQLLKGRTLLAIYAAEFFFGANLLGTMYYIPQFFQVVFGDSATISGVSLLPMMLGLAIGNPLAGWITSKWGISLWNAIVGGSLMVLTSGLITRWDADVSRAGAYVLIVFLGCGQGATMSGLLLSAQVAVTPMQIGAVTSLAIFVMSIGDVFGIAMFAAIFVNKFKDYLIKAGFPSDEIASILKDVTSIRHNTDATVVEAGVDAYARSLKAGWWLMFGCAVAVVVFSALSRQHRFGAKSD